MPQDTPPWSANLSPLPKRHLEVAQTLAAYAPEASAAQQRDFFTHFHQTLNAPSHPIRNGLLRLTADSPNLLAIIKQEGKA